MFSTAFSRAFCIPFFINIGFAPAVIFFIPSFTILYARTVAVVVPSPAISFVFIATSFKSSAPKFSISSSSTISFAILTPSFIITGGVNSLFKATFLPLGPKVIFTASANFVIPLCIASLASFPYNIFLAILTSLYNC